VVIVGGSGGKSDPFYNEIKTFAETNMANMGIMTQCVHSDRFRPDRRSGKAKVNEPAFVDNMLLKINAKLGGINFAPVVSERMKQVRLYTIRTCGRE
jgi:hypothetical protein